MFEYKCEIFNASGKALSTIFKDKEVLAFNELLNERASEGWELVTYTFMGSLGAPNGLLITYRKQINTAV